MGGGGGVLATAHVWERVVREKEDKLLSIKIMLLDYPKNIQQ